MKTKVRLVLFLLVGVIGFSLCSSWFKEGFELASEWKQHGQLSWDGPYSLPEHKPTPEGIWFLSNTKSSPKCCNSTTYSTGAGCLCTTPAQLHFLNMRGGNRSSDDGV